jgi:hypothetical protein
MGGPFGPMMMGPPPMMMRGPPPMMIRGPPPMMIRGPPMLPPPMMVIPGRGGGGGTGKKKKKKKMGKIVLYHLTSKDAGKKIKKSGKMLRGKTGLFGGGIYFAGSVADCQGKTQNGNAVTIKALVDMGTAIYLPNGRNDAYNYTYTKLKKMGCNSVHASGMRTGDEYIVYNHARVKILSIKDKYGKKI